MISVFQLVIFGDKEQPRKIAASWINGKVIWNVDISERVSLLRLVICYVLSCEKSNWAPALAKLFVNGCFGDDDDYENVRVFLLLIAYFWKMDRLVVEFLFMLILQK